MSNELEKVMDFGLEDDQYKKALESNVFGKKSADGVKQTSNFLTRIYSFDTELPKFKAFKYFWKICSATEKPQLIFLYAFTEDHLLFESLDVVRNHRLGEKVAVEDFKENLEKYYPNKYSKVTSHSIGKNLASSWKQAGHIEGKTKNIRVQAKISHKVAAFAFFLAFLHGASGEFILSHPVVKSLCISESELRELAIEAAKQDLLQYQYGGNVTTFAFPQLLSQLDIQV